MAKRTFDYSKLPAPMRLYHDRDGFRLADKTIVTLAVFADGLWHGEDDLRPVGGKRYDARRWDLHKLHAYVFDHRENPEGSGVHEYKLIDKKQSKFAREAKARLRVEQPVPSDWQKAISRPLMMLTSGRAPFRALRNTEARILKMLGWRPPRRRGPLR